jgi:hypothetical protein
MKRAKAIWMPGKERPATSQSRIQDLLRRSFTIRMLAKTRNPPTVGSQAKLQRVSIADSSGACPVLSAWITPQGATPAERLQR